MRGWGRRTCAIAALALLGGCCAAPPPAGRFFDRLDPFDTLSAFAYAIDAHQWPFAYEECLTARSRKLFTYTKFKLAMIFNPDVPVDAENPSLKIPIKDLILGADRYRYRYVRDGRSVAMRVKYVLPSGNPLIADIYLERETEEEARAGGHAEPRWLIDLDRTLLQLQGVNRMSNGPQAGRSRMPGDPPAGRSPSLAAVR